MKPDVQSLYLESREQATVRRRAAEPARAAVRGPRPDSKRQAQGVLGWTLFAVVAAVIAYRVLVTGLAEYYVTSGMDDAARRALAWHPGHPHAMTLLGIETAKTQPTEAALWLRRALGINVTDSDALIALAEIEEGRDRDRAGALLESAVALAPRRTEHRLAAASFWLRNGRGDMALRHFHAALTVKPELGKELYPVLMQLASDPKLETTIKEVVAEDPRWWDGFFAFVAEQSERTDILWSLHRARRDAGLAPSDRERRVFLSRLQRDGRWQDAYFYWLNSLSAEQRQTLGFVFNGGFELPVTNEGFDWHFDHAPGVTIRTEPTYGASGSRALHVVFQVGRTRFQHVHQYLMLEPGNYRLQGRVRPESLDVKNGMTWTLRCRESGEKLAVTSRFAGTDEWKTFRTEFNVPEAGCEVQDLRLELVGTYEFELQAKGGIWFDDISVTALGTP